jgi:hypothetical protein
MRLCLFLSVLLSLLGILSSATPAQASVINPTPVIISWPLTKAYPGIEYNIRLGVTGGKFPYTFSITEGPSGMQISPNGTVTWTPESDLEGQSYNVTLRVEDSLHQHVSQSFNLNVTQSGFYFVANGGNDDTGTGSITLPWATINKALASGNGSDFLYVRGGSYSGALKFQPNGLNKLAAFPGEQVKVDYNLENGTDIYNSQTYIDGFEIFNLQRWAFQVDGGKTSEDAQQSQLILRRNHMHHLYDHTSGGNPAFLFFWDTNPITDITPEKQYTNNIIQENVFHDQFDRGSGINGDNTANYHGGSNVWFNVAYSLYEDNEVYNIDGHGLIDKDDGYRNTYRGNYFHDNTFYPDNPSDPSAGLILMSQHSEDGAEVCYNIFEDRLVVGWQPGYIRNVEIHHNTFYRAGITYRWVLGEPQSTNFITRDNLFSELESAEGIPFAYMAASNKVLSDEATFDYNLIGTSSNTIYNGIGGAGGALSFSEWQNNYGKDQNSILDDPQLLNPVQNEFRPATGSPACGAASDGGDIGALSCSITTRPLAPVGLTIQ